MCNGLVHGHADVTCDLTQQVRGDVTAGMMRHCGGATVAMSVLLVRTLVTDGSEAKRDKNLLDLTRFEYWGFRHASDGDQLTNANDLGIDVVGVTIFEQHLDDLFLVGVQLVEGLGLGCVRRRSPG